MEATNELATKNPAEIRSPRICNHFFFCFEREKKEENINLQPCGLRILFSFSEDYETENIRIFGRDLYEQKEMDDRENFEGKI